MISEILARPLPLGGHFTTGDSWMGHYHRTRWNRLTQFVAMPLIIFSILIPMALLRFFIAGAELNPHA